MMRRFRCRGRGSLRPSGEHAPMVWRPAVVFAICFAIFYLGLIAVAILIGHLNTC